MINRRTKVIERVNTSKMIDDDTARVIVSYSTEDGEIDLLSVKVEAEYGERLGNGDFSKFRVLEANCNQLRLFSKLYKEAADLLEYEMKMNEL
jgi:hypothetical protein